MTVTRRLSHVEAEMSALKGAAERAGAALACTFQSSDDFEAAVITQRRAQGAYDPCGIERLRRALAAVALAGGLAFVWLLIF